MSKQFEPGTMVGSYKILSLLGRGGMGEVLLAEDTRLDRKVALKILPANLTHDPERLRRFTQEARAASALNHPNILTIYEVGEAEGAPFIATEFIQGETLRQRLNQGHLTVREALDVAIQAAGALGAAHEAGIVHRDIKPENIMIRADGYIKILDFGLAKLTERAGASTDTQAMTMTSPGMVMGTAQYMSPEQARGLTLDARSDIFSLGIVLYEMLAHKPPFEGDTPSHLIVAILDRNPQPITMVAPEVPPQLEPILEKALAKDREERYQTVKDLAVDLKSVRRRLDLETELRRATPSGGYAAAGATGSYGAATGFVSAQHSAAQPLHTAAQTSAALSSAPHPLEAGAPPSQEKLLRKSRKLFRIALILIAASIVYERGWLSRKHKSADTHSVENFQISRITTSGTAFSAAISPDGRYIVYAQSEHGLSSLWMRQTATASNIQIVAPAQVSYGGLAFSNDGNYLYFLRRSQTEQPALYKMPVLGGSPQIVMKSLQSAPTFSPDGKRLAFIRILSIQPSLKQLLLIANSDGSNEKQVAEIKDGSILRAIAWSPDGDSIAASVLKIDKGQRGSLILYNPSDGSAKAIMSDKFARIEDVAWANADGDLFVLAADQLGSPLQIWHVDTDSKRMKRLTNDINGFGGLAASVQTDQLVAIQPNVVANLWISTISDPASEKQITMGGARTDGSGGIAWTPDGRVVFHSRASGNDQIWIANADGSDAKQLTTTGVNVSPAASPDGKYIVYHCVIDGRGQICRMNPDGSDVRQLTNIKVAAGPSVSADSKWVLFHYFDDNDISVYRVSIDGGKPEKMAKGNCSMWGYSPDGQWILCALPDANLTSIAKIGLIPASGGDVVKTIDVPPVYAGTYTFAPDSQSLMYVYRKQGVSNIWSQPLAGGPPKQITNYTQGRIFSYAFSKSGDRLAVAKGDVMSDVVLLKNSE